jgi:multiple sugar transport system permease protein
MFQDVLFFKALRNTAYYSVLVIPLTVIFSLLLAMLINKKVLGITVFRGVFFLPAIIAWVASAFAWRWMLGVEGGWINFYLSKFGIKPHPWLWDEKTALSAVVIVAIWMGLAGKMIIFYAGLKSIPDDYYDAARIDGVNPLQNFFYITIPLLRNTTFFVIVITIVEEIKVFAKAYILVRGGQATEFNVLGGEPGYATLTIVGYVYGVGFRFLEFGYGSAISLFLLIAILIFTVLQFRLYARQSFTF